MHVYFFHPLILVADYGFAELKEISVCIEIEIALMTAVLYTLNRYVFIYT